MNDQRGNRRRGLVAALLLGCLLAGAGFVPAGTRAADNGILSLANCTLTGKAPDIAQLMATPAEMGPIERNAEANQAVTAARAGDFPTGEPVSADDVTAIGAVLQQYYACLARGELDAAHTLLTPMFLLTGEVNAKREGTLAATPAATPTLANGFVLVPSTTLQIVQAEQMIFGDVAVVAELTAPTGDGAQRHDLVFLSNRDGGWRIDAIGEDIPGLPAST